MLQGMHQRSKNVKKGVPLPTSQVLENGKKGPIFYEKFAFFFKKRGTFYKETVDGIKSFMSSYLMMISPNK